MVMSRIASIITGAHPGEEEQRQPPAGLVIRRPTSADMDALDGVFRRSWAKTYWNSMAEPERFLELPLNGRVKSNSLCAILDGQPVGFIEASRQVYERSFFWKPYETEVVSVSRLYVDPLHQGHGIGHELLAAIRRCYPGAASINLTALAGTTPVEEFYRRCGFQRIVTYVTDDGEVEPFRLHLFQCPANRLPKSRLPEAALCFDAVEPLRCPRQNASRAIDGPREPD